MKVIDLLNKIANGEEVPLILKYNNKIYEYTKEIDWYLREDLKSELFIDKSRLNDEVEIIEDTPEENKIPEEIECYHQYDQCVVKDKFYQDQKGSLVDEIIIDKINDLIYYLKSKGE